MFVLRMKKISLIYFTGNAIGIFLTIRLPHGHSIIIASVNYNQSDSQLFFHYMYSMHITKLIIRNIREELIVLPF